MMKTLAYFLALVGALLGAFLLIVTVVYDDSAPKVTAGALVALACAVIPYCLARCIHELGNQ